MSENTDNQGAESAATAAAGADAANTAAAESNAAAEKPAARRRVSRRATAPTGEPAVPEASAKEAPASADAAGGAAAEVAEAAPKKRATRSRKKIEEVPAEAGDAAPAAAASEAAEDAPKKRATRSRKKTEDASAETATVAEASTRAPATEDASADAAAEKPAAKRRTSRRATKASAEADAAAEANAETAAGSGSGSSAAEGASAAGAPDAAGTDAAAPDAAGTEAAGTEAAGTDAAGGSNDGSAAEGDSAAEEQQPARGRRSRSRKGEGDAAKGDASDDAAAGESAKPEKQNGAEKQNGSEGGEKSPEEANGNGNGRKGKGRGKNQERQNDGGSDKNDRDRSDRSDRSGDKQDSESAGRSSRTRQRDRKRRGQGDDFEPEIAEDDVLLPIAGILDVLDNYAFVRTSGYLPGMSDVYVSLGQVKKYGMRKGDAVVGAIRQPREGESGRQKYNAIVKVDAVNGRPTDENQNRTDFAETTPVYPQQRVLVESADSTAVARAIDLLAPIGLGQRGLVVGRPGAGKSAVLRSIAAAVASSFPDAHLMMVLVDERPEEVTELQRTIKGEVVASTFDRTAEDHATVAELSVERAKRLVELGHDVVVLLDSITVLGRAHLQRTPNGRGAETGFDPAALQPVKRLLAAARNVENGGSLTIIATALEKSGSKLDKAILGELESAANSRIRLTGEGVVPEVDPQGTFTVRPEALVGEEEAAAVRSLRALLAEDDADDELAKRLAKSSSNAALLAEVRRSGKL